jgi:hypothetical protein
MRFERELASGQGRGDELSVFSGVALEVMRVEVSKRSVAKLVAGRSRSRRG